MEPSSVERHSFAPRSKDRARRRHRPIQSTQQSVASTAPLESRPDAGVSPSSVEELPTKHLSALLRRVTLLRPSVDGCTGFLSLTLLREGFSTVAVAALTAVQTTRYVQRVRERVLLIFLEPFALLATHAPSRSVSTCFSSRSKCST